MGRGERNRDKETETCPDPHTSKLSLSAAKQGDLPQALDSLLIYLGGGERKRETERGGDAILAQAASGSRPRPQKEEGLQTLSAARVWESKGWSPCHPPELRVRGTTRPPAGGCAGGRR